MDDVVYEVIQEPNDAPYDTRDPVYETDAWAQGRNVPLRPTAQPYYPQPQYATTQGYDYPQYPQRMSTIGAVTASVPEHPPARIVHDVPPTWDGSNPEKELEPYLKLLSGWLQTTRTLKTQRGMIILNFATGDLKLIVNELEVEHLTSEDSGDIVLKHVQSSFAEYQEKKMPNAIEAAIYDKDTRRRRGEGMLQYCARRKTHFKELKKQGIDLPDQAKGYILMRDAQLTDKARELLEMWSGGTYPYDATTPNMNTWLKKLERPVPGTDVKKLLGLEGFVGDGHPAAAGESGSSQVYAMGESMEPTPLTFMSQSLFLSLIHI